MQTELMPGQVNVYNRLMGACGSKKLMRKGADFASPLTDRYLRVREHLPRTHRLFLAFAEATISPDLVRKKEGDMPVISTFDFEMRVSAVERKNGQPWVRRPAETDGVAVISSKCAAAAVLPALLQMEKTLQEELAGHERAMKMPLRVKLNIARAAVAPAVAGTACGMLLASRSMTQAALAVVALAAGGLAAILAAKRHFSDNSYAKAKAAVKDFAEFVRGLKSEAERFLGNNGNGTNGNAMRHPKYF